MCLELIDGKVNYMKITSSVLANTSYVSMEWDKDENTLEAIYPGLLKETAKTSIKCICVQDKEIRHLAILDYNV